MDANVTLKVSPWEFDLLRRSLENYRDHLRNLVNGEAGVPTGPEDRTEARKTLIAVNDVLARLGVAK